MWKVKWREKIFYLHSHFPKAYTTWICVRLEPECWAEEQCKYLLILKKGLFKWNTPSTIKRKHARDMFCLLYDNSHHTVQKKSYLETPTVVLKMFWHASYPHTQLILPHVTVYSCYLCLCKPKFQKNCKMKHKRGNNASDLSWELPWAQVF